MEFSRFDYGFTGIILPVAIFFVIIVGAVFFSRYLAVKKYSWRAIIFMWVIVLALLLHGLLIYSQGFSYPISAVLQTDTMQYITVGGVEQVRSAPYPPIYFDPITNALSPAKLLTVSGMQFYLPYCDVEVGQTVELLWATKEHVVYAYHILPDGGSSGNCTYPIASPNSSHQHNAYTYVGQILALSSVSLFVLIVLLQYPIGRKLAIYFAKKDREIANKIIPNRFGLLYVCCLIFPLLGTLSGMALKGFTGASIILLAGATMIAVQVFRKQTTTAFIEGDLLVIKEFKSMRRLEKDSIASARFVASRLPYNRCLMIKLKNGMFFRFEQENFYGLDSMHMMLCELLKENPSGR